MAPTNNRAAAEGGVRFSNTDIQQKFLCRVGGGDRRRNQPLVLALSAQSHDTLAEDGFLTRSADQARGSEIVSLIPALRAFARTFCSRSEDADDLVQETLIKALDNIDHFEAGTRLKSWMFTIMRNTFYTRHERAARERVGLPEDLAKQLAIDADQDWSVQAEEVRRALNRLPQHHQEILILIVMLGERYEDAAAICDCKIGTVKSRLNRARRQLRIELGDMADEAGARD